jgi:putative transcriptional regulator
MSKIGEGIIRGIEQALAFADGTGDPSEYVVHIPPEIDVKAIRGRLGLTQEEFADRFWFSIDALHDFERGSRVPDDPTRAGLMVIDREPEAVQKALWIA